MTEPAAPIASSSSQKTPEKQRGKKAQLDKVVSPAARVLVASRGSSSSSSVPAGPPSSSSSDPDEAELADFGDFDYDSVKADDGVELWLVRAPSNVRPRRFSLPFRSPHPHLFFFLFLFFCPCFVLLLLLL